MRKYTELLVWKRAHELTLMIYRATKDFPPEERYGLVSQLRRACVSVEANLAEGSGRKSDADFARFVNMSEGSAAEVEVLLKISIDVGCFNYLQFDDEGKYTAELMFSVADVIKMLRALHKSLEVSS